MKKLSISLAMATLAVASTLTISCGEKTKTPTPEEIKLAVVQEGKKAQQKIWELNKNIDEKTEDSLIKIINEGRKAEGNVLKMLTKKEKKIWTKKQK